MKLLLAAVLLAGIPSLAQAEGRTIVNHSGVDIDELYAMPSNGRSWSPNLMAGAPEKALDDGMSWTVAGLPSGTYDLKIVDPDEAKECVLKHVRVLSGLPLELTTTIMAPCN